jgi:hypothetical protein
VRNSRARHIRGFLRSIVRATFSTEDAFGEAYLPVEAALLVAWQTNGKFQLARTLLEKLAKRRATRYREDVETTIARSPPRYVGHPLDDP